MKDAIELKGTMTDYDRALIAEPDLRAIDRLVDVLYALVRPTDRLCAGCVWGEIVKPLASRLVGWERGIFEQAEDPADEPADLAELMSRSMVTGAEMADRLDKLDERRGEPESETERWLRSSEAFDAVTDVWLDRLERADPANGHGIGRAEA